MWLTFIPLTHPEMSAFNPGIGLFEYENNGSHANFKLFLYRIEAKWAQNFKNSELCGCGGDCFI